MSVSSLRFVRIVLLLTLAFLPGIAFSATRQVTKQIIVPEADRFVPFAITVHAGDTVEWINNDEDDHKIMTVDQLTTAGHHGLVHLLKGTENNGGQPGHFSLKFVVPGRFVYRCAFHSKLDEEHQPVAPGPKGGIQDSHGNYGTPMMGVITVLPPE